MIRSAEPSDAEQIVAIYNHYILTSVITFETEIISAEEMRSRMLEVTRKFPWLVYEENGEVIGYAYASAWKVRAAYRHSVESTIYLHPDHPKKGIGTKLYKDLISKLSSMDVHAVIGGIALPNDASVALHEKLGFKKVAHFEEVGFKFSRWIDVGYWEQILHH